MTARALAIAAGAAAALGCAQLGPPLPASGEVAGFRLATTVDGAAARYYLEHYLRRDRRDRALDEAFDALHAASGPPTRELLRELAARYSPDFASLYLAQALQSEPANRQFQGTFRRERAALEAGAPPAHPRFGDYRLLFVPGWDYRSSGAITGADFALQRRLLNAVGLESRLVEIPSLGSVETNARALAGALRATAPDGRIILASASSAGPAVALALGELLRPEETCRVHAWINIGGLLRGTPFADRYRRWPRSWIASIVGFFYGWDKGAVESMSSERSRERLARLRWPAHVLTLNYVGIALSGTVSALARDNYQWMRHEGPNDGLTLVTDALAPGAPTLVELGRDHYLAEDPEIGAKTLALARTLMVYLEAPRAACPPSQSP